MANIAVSTPAGDVVKTPVQVAEPDKKETLMLELGGTALDAFNYIFVRKNAAKIAIHGSKSLDGMRERFALDYLIDHIKKEANVTWARDYRAENNIGPKTEVPTRFK